MKNVIAALILSSVAIGAYAQTPAYGVPGRHVAPRHHVHHRHHHHAHKPGPGVVRH